MEYELSIMTGDKWVVTLLSDQDLTFDPPDVIIHSIIVQPLEDYEAGKNHSAGVQRRVYKLTKANK